MFTIKIVKPTQHKQIKKMFPFTLNFQDWEKAQEAVTQLFPVEVKIVDTELQEK